MRKVRARDAVRDARETKRVGSRTRKKRAIPMRVRGSPRPGRRRRRRRPFSLSLSGRPGTCAADSGSQTQKGPMVPFPRRVDGQENGKKGLEDVQEGCAESQEEATLPQDVGAADVSASLGPDVLPVTPVIKKVTVGNRGQQVGPAIKEESSWFHSQLHRG